MFTQGIERNNLTQRARIKRPVRKILSLNNLIFMVIVICTV
ncbi:IS1 family transposase [Pectobacterium parmentieri]|nr:hypothetical protein [Pectobacterium parmentieri]MBI0558296.1 hypothetical protein [Pectobacterium parmentieri]